LRRVAVVLAALAMHGAPAFAGVTTSGGADDARWTLQVDNDVLFATDRWYSSGVRVSRFAGTSEWGLVHEVFTPEAKYFERGVRDRAPTARLVAFHARHWRGESSFLTAEAQLGVRGEGAKGEQVTDAVHHVVSAPAVDWSREVSSRVDGRIAGTGSYAFGPLMGHAGAVLGSQLSFVHAGLQLSLGPVMLPAQVLRHVATPPFDVAQPSRRGWGMFAGVSARRVTRDRTVETSYDPLLPPLRREDAVARFAIGGTLLHRWGAVSLAAVQDTRQYVGQRQPQRFGSLAVHVPF
jgi:hypothetical protein